MRDPDDDYVSDIDWGWMDGRHITAGDGLVHVVDHAYANIDDGYPEGWVDLCCRDDAAMGGKLEEYKKRLTVERVTCFGCMGGR